jgi:uncharacterized protein with HEPN domain
MIKAIDEAISISNHPSFDEFKKDRAAVLAILTCVHILGEASNHIPEAVKQKHSEIPWVLIKGMRNRVAHEYFEVDENIVWATCRVDFPKLRPQLLKILSLDDAY